MRESIRLSEEPAKDAEGACEIVFRAPGSGQRITRRFLKSEKLATIYDFVRTLDDDTLGFEERLSQFKIIQPMPRKVFEDSQETTLEEAGLFPRAMVQIQECTD